MFFYKNDDSPSPFMFSEKQLQVSLGPLTNEAEPRTYINSILQNCVDYIVYTSLLPADCCPNVPGNDFFRENIFLKMKKLLCVAAEP